MKETLLIVIAALLLISNNQEAPERNYNQDILTSGGLIVLNQEG
jgi:hypothetical protein